MIAGLKLWLHLLIDRCWPRAVARHPEPDALMDNPEQSRAYREAGEDEGAIAFTQLFHALHVTPLIRPGDVVLDLACGAGTQLARIAALNPSAHFLGVDGSRHMLGAAQGTLASHGIHNVRLVQGDIRNLDFLADGCCDVVLCTMSFHHLPGLAALEQSLREARRVLRFPGAAYFADFGRLRRAETMQFLARDRQSTQSAQFTQDYLRSMQAAFRASELRAAVHQTFAGLECHVTPVAPFLLVWRSAPLEPLHHAAIARIEDALTRTHPAQRRDLGDLARWFAIAGLRLPPGVFAARSSHR